jgi:kynurenine formamidase
MIYLSHVITEDTPSYGGTGKARIILENKISDGKSSNTQRWDISNHIGTHVDGPRHFFADGMTLDEYPPEFWICHIVSLVDVPLDKARWIEPGDIVGKIDPSTECILIRTGWQKHRFEEMYFLDNPGLSADLAKWLRKTFPNLRFVGMDFISISMFQDRPNGRAAHKAFLDSSCDGKPILPIEDMDLKHLHGKARITSLVVAPLRVKVADGSPVTVIAQLND